MHYPPFNSHILSGKFPNEDFKVQRGSVMLHGHMHKLQLVELGPELRCNGALKRDS